MGKMWAGRTSGDTNKIADDFNSSFSFDSRMYEQDIKGSMAHATMLAVKNIITKEEADTICAGLQGILEDLESGEILFNLPNGDLHKIENSSTAFEIPEDIHMFIEAELTKRVGEAGKKVHTARSRNDQVALDLRMYLKSEIDEISELIKKLGKAILTLAEGNKETIMPGYTHLQRAQPVTFAHHILAYGMMLSRDLSRLNDCAARMNVCPIGSCALAGTTYDTDRDYEASLLGFESVALNSMDGVSDRDFAIELLSALSILMMHLSRFSEEILLWTSWEFHFVTLSDDFTTGSSIMPQKKNSDMAELVRGKTGRVYGELMGLLTTMKGLPLAYNKDMQEDKEGLFDSIDTVKMCLQVFEGMISTLKVNPEEMRSAANKGFINATDLADYLVGKGLAFRDAYKISGTMVSECITGGFTLETLPLEKYVEICGRVGGDIGINTNGIIDKDVYDAVDIANCTFRRTSKGGPSIESTTAQIEYLRGLF